MYVTMIIAYSMTSRTESYVSDDHRYVHLGLGTRLTCSGDVIAVGNLGLGTRLSVTTGMLCWRRANWTGNGAKHFHQREACGRV